jgi:hypothetical protein
MSVTPGGDVVTFPPFKREGRIDKSGAMVDPGRDHATSGRQMRGEP